MKDASGQWTYSTIFAGRHGLAMAMDSTESPHMTWHVDGVDEVRYAQFDSTGTSATRYGLMQTPVGAALIQAEGEGHL